jgi:5-methylcytosine-specific restriction endonuclease McrA
MNANLKSLTDLELDCGAVVAAKNERAALVVVLQHLAEIDRRKSFSPRYQSIHAYAVGHLGYDSKSAWRRVNAMYLMRELPEITPAIETGKLDLTKMILAQNHFRVERKESKNPSALLTESFLPRETPRLVLTKDDKIEILQTVMQQTSREAERQLTARSSAPAKFKRPDTIKPLAGCENEARLIFSDEDLEIIQELKGLLAHKYPNASVSEIVSAALKEARDAIKKEKSGENRKRRAALERTRSDDAIAKAKLKAENTRQPNRTLRIKIWNRAGGRCEICHSTYALENDHRTPWAKGGKTKLENARLLCRNCNQREAIKIFGPHTIRERQAPYALNQASNASCTRARASTFFSSRIQAFASDRRRRRDQ